MTVQDLSRVQLDELKQNYFWGEDTEDMVPEDITSPEEIPDEIIFEYYAGIHFVDDDFG